MDIDDPGWPLLDDFFHELADGRAAATARRYARVRSRLYAFLDTGDLALGLGADVATLLEAEREFHDTGAFWHLLGTDDLVCCLPSFLHPSWLPDGVQEARTQVAVVSRLLPVLRRASERPAGVTRGAFREAEAAVDRARREIAARPAPVRAQHVPQRLRQQPGPQW